MTGRDSGEADVVFGAGVQRGWEASVREHGFGDGSGGRWRRQTGSGVVVYGFDAGEDYAERMMTIPLQQLAAGRKTMLIGGVDGDKGVPFPAAIAVVGRCVAAERAAGGGESVGRCAADGCETGQVRSGSICRRAMRCLRLIRWRWRCRRTGRGRLWRCGMRARWWSWT